MISGVLTATTDRTAAATKPFGWRFTAPLLLGSTLNPINSSMLATGLLAIGLDFHLGPGKTASLISVLYLCSAILQPTMGKLSTVFGPRRVFVSGIVILLIAGVVGAAAPDFGFLLVSRALIGIGSSAAYPTAMAMVRRRADEHGVGVPSRVLGNFSIAAQITAVVGLPLGGILAGAFGWRALFLVNVPLALIVLTFTLLGVEKDAPRERGGVRSLLVSVDLPGIGLFAATIVSLLLFLSSLSAPIWWLLPIVVVCAAALILWERRASRPLIDVRMLGSNGPLQRTYLRQTLSALVSYSTLYGVSQWMEQSAGYTPTQVGLILLPLSGISIVLARIVSNRGWVRSPLLLGALAIAAAATLLLLMDAHTSVWLLLLMAALLGVANGLTGFANQASLYVQAPAGEIAVASGLYRTFAYIGAIFSSSLIGITFGEAATDAGLHTLAWVMAGIGVALLVITGLDRRIPRETAGERV